MSRVIAHGATDQSTVVRLAYGNGTLRTDVTAGTGNIAMQYRREGGNVTDCGTVGNLASGAAAHTDAGIVHLTGAYYRVDPPDAAWATGAAGVLVTVSGDDITCIGAYHPLGPQAADVQAWDGNTTNISVSVDGAPIVALVDGTHGGTSATLALASLSMTGNLSVGGSANIDNDLAVGLSSSFGDVTMASQTVTANLTVGNMVATGTITRGGTALSTYAGADTSGTTTLLSRLTATRAGYIDNLQNGNVALEATAQSILTDTAEIGAAGAGLTEAGGTGDHLTAVPWNAAWDAEVQSEVADGLAAFWTSPASLVDLIWDEPTSGHATAGTTGKALTDAGSAGDPWSTALPGAYASGTAGNIVGNRLDATVSSRGTYDGGDITGNLSGSVGSVTGAVGSVTGNVGGSVVGSVASVTGTVGGVAGTIQTLDALDAAQDAQHTTTQGRLPAALVNGRIDATVDGTGMESGAVAAILTTQMTEAYAADGTAPTLAQALFLIQQTLGDFAISGTTLTVKKLDGSTTAATFTLDDASAPTSITRAS